MKHQRDFSIKDISSWDDEVNSAVKGFYSTYHKYPHILVGSNKTYAEIDKNADIKNIYKEDGEQAEEQVSMVGFDTYSYHLAFCIDDKMPKRTLSLVYDSEAEFI